MISKPKSEKSSYSGQIIARMLRPIFAVILLSALVLSIAYGVKGLSELQPAGLASLLNPILAKVNIQLDEDQLAQVAGAFASRVSKTDISNVPSLNEDANGTKALTSPNREIKFKKDVLSTTQETADTSSVAVEKKDKLLTIALLADAHSDYDNLSLALNKVKNDGISTFFFLGDATELGLLDDLQKAKALMDQSGLEYYAISGDHDLWKSVGHDNFLQVFGKKNYTKTISNVKFVLLDNSANYTPIDADSMNWFKKEVATADYVILSQPLYHPTMSRVMGIVDGEEQPALQEQASELLTAIREANVKAIIAGDHHLSSENPDTSKPSLQHIVVGALTSERNLQSPRYSILNVFTDKSFEIQDIDL